MKKALFIIIGLFALASTSFAQDLEVLDFRLNRSSSVYLKAEGRVKNISTKPIKNAWAIVTFYDSKKNMITSQTGILKFNPLLPGQTSVFDVMIREQSDITSAYVEFGYIGGVKIPHTVKK